MIDKIKLGFDGNTREVDNKFPEGAPPAWGADANLDVVGKDHTQTITFRDYDAINLCARA